MRIVFVVDHPGLAFDSVAKRAQRVILEKGDIASIVYHHKSSFHRLMAEILNSEPDHVHFFWRKIFKDLIEHFTITDAKTLERLFFYSRLSFSIADHLYCDDDGISEYLSIFYLADGYIVISKRLHEMYSGLHHISPPTQVIYDRNDKVMDLLKAPMNEPKDGTRALWVGNSRWGEWQGFDDFKGLRSVILPAVKSLAGCGVTLRAIDSHTGRQDDSTIERAFTNSDVYLNASIHEGTPLPILEAMAAGKAIISTDVGVLREISGPLQRTLICGRSPDEFVERLKLIQDLTFLKAVQKENREMAAQFVNNTGYFAWTEFFSKLNRQKDKRELRKNFLYTFIRRQRFASRKIVQLKSWTIASLRSKQLVRNIASANPKLAIRVHDFLSKRQTIGSLPFYDILAERRDREMETLAIFAPCWRGVANSTKSLFDHVFAVPISSRVYPETVATAELDCYLEAVISLSPKKVVISGGDYVHLQLVKRLHTVNPNLPIELLWHGNQAQWISHYERGMFFEWLDLASVGLIRKIWLLKSGLEEMVADLGIKCELIFNLPPDSSVFPLRRTLSNPITVGIWADRFDWRKNVISQGLALAGFNNVLCYHNCGDPVFEVIISKFGVRATRIADGPVPHAKFLDYLSKIDMHLYVTLCETSPMIPLESAIYGRPCLVGPTTTCFNDHQFLREHLVVESPDDISSISRKIQGVIEAYDEISPQLCKWVGDKKKEGQKFRARLNSKEN